MPKGYHKILYFSLDCKNTIHHNEDDLMLGAVVDAGHVFLIFILFIYLLISRT